MTVNKLSNTTNNKFEQTNKQILRNSSYNTVNKITHIANATRQAFILSVLTTYTQHKQANHKLNDQINDKSKQIHK